MADWKEIGIIEDIPKLGSRIVEGPDGDIAIFRNSKDEIFALKDECPHKQGPLSQGIVHDRTVTCPLHNWKIELDTGVVKAPDEGCAGRYDIKIETGKIFISL